MTEQTDEASSVGSTILKRINQLAQLTEEEGILVRPYLTPSHRQANELVEKWMIEAGMSARIDAVGNIIGRYEGVKPGLPALVLGSHLDTVRDAGKYDGMLGVVSAISCVNTIYESEERLPFAIEIIGFADEEGLRFQTGLIGSGAIAGILPTSELELVDGNDISLAQAMRDFGLDPENITSAAKRPEEILAYMELHIEQGPVLENEGLAVGVVSAISGATRLSVHITGMAGHAGTVPMGQRQDALTAAAEGFLYIERRCSETETLVGTVGSLEVSPGAGNVIPGGARFSVDIRAEQDQVREKAVEDVTTFLNDIAGKRGVQITIENNYEQQSCYCSPWLIEQISDSIEKAGISVRLLPSGAGHDGMAMERITDIGMLFVRCKGGISHNPLEEISKDDADLSASILTNIIRHFKPKDKA